MEEFLLICAAAKNKLLPTFEVVARGPMMVMLLYTPLV